MNDMKFSEITEVERSNKSEKTVYKPTYQNISKREIDELLFSQINIHNRLSFEEDQ
jgi:hypothetical protein